ncbi:MAG TPA: hypothetical protein VGB87_21685 [Vicinamibacteria bacterium]
MLSRLGRTLVVSLLALAPAAAHAGPPLICHPMAIGSSPSLAWGSGSGWKNPLPGYDRSRLAADTKALLGPQTPVLARMETLRRAVVYASTDAAAASALFAALRERSAQSPGDPLATFDLGYAVAAWGEMQHASERRVAGTVPTEDGYALVRRALAARGTDPEMEYAAALITGRQPAGPADEHLRRAVAGAGEGSLLAATIDAHRHLWGGRAEALRASSR